MSTAQQWISENELFEVTSGHNVAFRRRGAGPTIVLLHGFPTWSFDYRELADNLATDHDVVTLDFLGYGASDKPRDHEFSVEESADIVEELLNALSIDAASLILHDYGGLVGQELVHRHNRSALSFSLKAVHLLNSGIVYEKYRPTVLQRLLITPGVGPLVSKLSTKARVRGALDAVWGDNALSDAEYSELWAGIERKDGHRLAHRLIRYNAERARNHRRWLDALVDYDGPLQLIWGLADPVSGEHVLSAARAVLAGAPVTELAGVGHYPQTEDPGAVAVAVRQEVPPR